MALRLIGVSKTYGDQTVLDGISLHVRPGDCYGFLGHNGAGKSTAMRIALGLVRPDSGRVIVDGFDAAEHPLEARARMGALIEVPGFHGALSGHRNLVLLARLQGLGGRAASVEADRALDAVGLTHAARKAAGAYSQGMRQRLGIAQAILGRPRIVLLDEPTNGLDPEGIEEVRRLLRRLTRDEGTTVLLSSHQLHEMEGVCNRVGIIRQGRMLVEEETSGLVAAGGSRHVVRTDDDQVARRVLSGLGLAVRAAGVGSDDYVEFDLGGVPAGDVARALVAAGLDLRSFAPRETSLEEIYLRFTQGGDAATAAPVPSDVTASQPSERLAAPGPLRRTAMYDVRRWISGPAVPAALAVPAAVAVLAVFSESALAARIAGDVTSGAVASSTHFTAFTATARALSKGLPLLALVASATAALSLAGEFGRGTLRNVVLRPVGRSRMVMGKAVAALAATVTAYALLLATAMACAAVFFDFDDLVEILPGGQRYVFEGFAAADLWPEMLHTAWAQCPALLAFAAIGILVGSHAKSGAGAVVGVFGVTLTLVGAPAILGRSAAAWLPSGHLPWVLSDASPTRRLFDLSTGVSNASTADARSLWVPLIWGAACILFACVRMRRRPIP
ncbi:MAG: ATP-binding cassette domain-containing protein [Planctomycetes bacterium]|nr:ATP-binding cassette domain-containing protein [Planctomycetota bacterium]